MNEALTDYEWEGRRGTGISEYLTQMPPAGKPAAGCAKVRPPMSATTASDSDIHTRPAELLRNLIRFDTTNPPGNERACISYIEGLVSAAGIESVIRARDPERPNLIARLPGRGAAPPLLLQGHVDVVSTAGQEWSHPPFDAVEADGFIWGRGAVDMKGGVAMMLSAFLRARAEGLEPPGDVIFCALADEEGLSGYGADWLVREHAGPVRRRAVRDRRVRGVHVTRQPGGACTRSRWPRSRCARCA